jgi:hypothetical protein
VSKLNNNISKFNSQFIKKIWKNKDNLDNITSIFITILDNIITQDNIDN